MAPSATVVAALLRLSYANDVQSMLQMPAMVEKHVQTSDCACPAYFEEQCTENAFQGCIWTSDDLGAHPQGWTDRGLSNEPWCQCDPHFVGTPPLFNQPAVASCPAGWDQKGALGADIGGCGLQSCGERYDLSSEIECAARCDATWTCQGFSWAPMDGDRNHPGVTACTIYNSDVPTGTWTGVDGTASQVFCGRSFWARLGSEAQGTVTCPAGTEGISQEDCWEAGQRLIPTGGTSAMQELNLGTWNHVPTGCSVRHLNFNVLFNSNTNPNGNNGDWVPICSN